MCIYVLPAFCSIDDGFPVVTFHFDQSLSLPVYPREYLFEVRVSMLDLFQIFHCRYDLFPELLSQYITVNLQETEYCIGWQSSGLQTRDGREMTLLGGTFSLLFLIPCCTPRSVDVTFRSNFSCASPGSLIIGFSISKFDV